MGPGPDALAPRLAMKMEAGYLFAALVWGAVGLGMCVYGKKAQRGAILIGGLGIIGATYFLPSAAEMSLVACLILGSVYWLNQRED